MEDGYNLYLLVGGRLVNLAAADGPPVELMDMSFATLPSFKSNEKSESGK